MQTEDEAAQHGGERREQVVAISVFKRKDLDTYWPFKAVERWNEFDFYINAKFLRSLAEIRNELNERADAARLQKVQAPVRRDEHLAE